ncbi:MAG: MFS transporter [Hyphomicrobiales bacterium]|nr:MFS transporter [Hyphomicrobiales bacterium]
MAGAGGFGGIAKAFESRNFRIYWTGNFTHTVTVWVNRMAVAWLTWQLTHSPTWLGIMAAANMLPTIVLGPIGGVTADRFGHRFQLVTATYVGGFVALLLTVLVALDALNVQWLAFIVLISGIIRGFNVPARSALVSNLVERQYLASAIGINSASFHGGNFIGPVIGGFLINYLGISLAFLAYAAGEFIAATSFLLLNLQSQKRSGKKFRLFRDLAEGFAYTWNHAGILSVLSLVLVTALFINPYIEMLPAFVARVYHMNAEGLAYLTAATGGGAMVGGLWVARRGRMEGLVTIQLTMLAVAYVAIFIFAATSSLPIAMAALCVAGFALVSSQTSASSLVQNAVDPAIRARVVSLNGVIIVSMPAFGAMGIGWIAEFTGVQKPVMVSAVIALVCLALLARRTAQNARALEHTGDS